MRFNKLQAFLALESASAIILLVMAILAMVWANSPLAFLHQQFITTFLFMINDGFMSLFFLLVGLELKRGFVSGQLAKRTAIALPLLAAIGGMLLPACIYLAINYADPITIHGWSTPLATDIAFAVGVLSLFGRRVPFALKLFLLALAIFDDVGAIIIIALFYSQSISLFYLAMALSFLFILYLFNRYAIDTIFPYLLAGIGLWFSFLYAGIHPTLAGVLLAFAIPMQSLPSLETKLHPYVAYLIMPLFALANAGFSLQGLSLDIKNTLVAGIILGLFVGKQAGVFGLSWFFIKLRYATLPEKTTWLQLYGVALLCGIGFTMSLFLGTLSFQNEGILYLAQVRLGVIIGSILSGVMGAIVLVFAFKENHR